MTVPSNEPVAPPLGFGPPSGRDRLKRPLGPSQFAQVSEAILWAVFAILVFCVGMIVFAVAAAILSQGITDPISAGVLIVTFGIVVFIAVRLAVHPLVRRLDTIIWLLRNKN